MGGLAAVEGTGVGGVADGGTEVGTLAGVGTEVGTLGGGTGVGTAPAVGDLVGGAGQFPSHCPHFKRRIARSEIPTVQSLLMSVPSHGSART